MKRFILITLVAVGSAGFAEDQLSFKGLADFRAPNAQISWQSPAKCPATLWVYKVVTQTYSPAVISNLMALGSFTMDDRIQSDTNAIRFRSRDQVRHLEIAPASGWVRYWDNNATDTYKRKIQGVPSEKETEDKALELLSRLGIQRSDFATRPDSSRLLAFGERSTTERFEKETGERVTSVYERGVFLIRQVDGIHFAGLGLNGGAHASFSLGGKLAQFEVLWRNLQPAERRRVASPEQITRWIKEGRAAMTHRDAVDPSEIEKITITGLAPMYMGEPPNEHQTLVYPFAQIEAIADIGSTNSPIQLYCPIVTTEIVP